MNPSKIIDELGGTAAVARLCNVRQATVSGWRRRGIPRGWLAFLQTLNTKGEQK